MDKYQIALLELAKASNAAKHVNQEIGAELALSYVEAEKTWPREIGYNPVPPKEWESGGKNGWLVLAYQIEREHYGSGVFDTYYANHDDDVEGFLAEKCKHALRAHQLIQQRKQLRKNLGVAKRRVTFLGNKLLEASQS